MTGSEGAIRPFWSPDGRQIAFVAPSRTLKKVDLLGGPAQTVCPMPGLGLPEGLTWSRDDVIVFSAGGKLFRVSARGGEPVPLGALAEGESARFWPQFLPDGRHYLYVSLAPRPEDQGIYVGSLDSDLRQRIVASEYKAGYSSGHLLFVKDESLMAQAFDATRLGLSGQPVPVIQQLALRKGARPAPGATYSASANGVLAWRAAWTAGSPSSSIWFDRSGRQLGTVGGRAKYFGFSLSPDETSLALCRTDPVTNVKNQRDIWIIDVARGTSRRLTFDAGDDCNPAWSPDGSRVAFFSDRRGVREIYEKPANGSGDDSLVFASRDQPLNLEDWSADGRFLVYNAPVPGGNKNDLFLLPLSSAGERKPIAFLGTPALEHMGALAPNGRWLAYRSAELGPGEVYVRDLSPQGERGPGKWQVSTGGGMEPRWRRDGKELFYVSGSTIMAVAVEPEATLLRSRRPAGRSSTFPCPSSPLDRFDVTRDGQRFLVDTPLTPHGAHPRPGERAAVGTIDDGHAPSSRHASRPVRDRRPDRRGRDGGRLQGARHAARADGRDQGLEGGLQRALPQRGARRRRPQPPPHLHAARRGARLPGDGVRRRQAAARARCPSPRSCGWPARSRTRSSTRTRRRSSTAT